MTGLTTETKDEMLGVFAGKTFEVALYSGEEEIADAIYRRQEVTFSPPKGRQGVRYVDNEAKVLFEGFNNRHQVDHWAILDHRGVRALYKLTKPLEVSSEMDAKFLPGELRIGLP